ncbi:MAG TPA: ABC-2 family transporter protein [Candidatus Bathyarchaeia archaeon]|nr:ABC-2 family transporter protein [Candidatus Bathyarchaeia archaeon]
MENRLKKYLQIAKMVWYESFTYRLNFIVWQLRSFLLLLGGYFFWYAVYRFNNQIGVYDEKLMLTYVLLSSFLQSLILTSRSFQIAEDIATGRLNNRLIKPISYLKSMFSLDLGVKAASIFFLFFQLALIFIVLKPPFFVQKDPLQLLSFILVSFGGLFIYFYLSSLISLVTFWYPEDYGWPARFLFMVVNNFLSGGVLPLDILPVPIFNFLRFLPSANFIFFPLQVYLGKVNPSQLFHGFLMILFWIIVLKIITDFTWKKGLKNYTAVGI